MDPMETDRGFLLDAWHAIFQLIDDMLVHVNDPVTSPFTESSRTTVENGVMTTVIKTRSDRIRQQQQQQ